MEFYRSRSNKRFPHLAAYLKAVVEKRIVRGNLLSALIGGAAVWIVVQLALMVAWFMTNQFAAMLVTGVVALPASLVAWFLINQKIKSPKSPLEAKRQQAWKVAWALHNLENQRRMHKRLDPSISQLLEAAAFHYQRIQGALSGGYWRGENLPAHWLSVRSQAMDAADQAMEELLLLAEPCTGEPETNRGKAIKEVFEDFFELDIGEAVGGLREIAISDWTRYAHRSPFAPVAFETGRAIAERLKRLADEVESKGNEIAIETGAPQAVQSATDTIDIVLGEIASVREAEGELRERL